MFWVGIVISLLLIVLSIFADANHVTELHINGKLIKKTDPEYSHDLMMWRIGMAFSGVITLCISTGCLLKLNKKEVAINIGLKA
jgi:hypothetical protein